MMENDNEMEVEEVKEQANFYPLLALTSQSQEPMIARSTSEISCRNRSTKSQSARPMHVLMTVNGIRMQLEVDTGSYVTVVSETTWSEMLGKCKLSYSDMTLKGYGGILLKPVGMLSNASVTFRGKTRKLVFYVLPGTGPSLIGRQWLAAFDEWPFRFLSSTEASRLQKLLNVDKVDEVIFNQFPKLFGTEPGFYAKGSLKLKLRDCAKPVVLKTRNVPSTLKTKVESELEKLLKSNYLIPVEKSDWQTPIALITKPDGGMHVCGDFKLTLNKYLAFDRHVLPTINDIYRKLLGGKKFTRLRLAYSNIQIPIDEASRKFFTITTHKGLFRYLIMPESFAMGPEDVQRKIELCLQGIDHVIAYLNNIFVTGPSDAKHVQTLRLTCGRLEESGFRLEGKDCQFLRDKIEILGHIIDKDGMRKSLCDVKAILKAPKPQNNKQLLALLGIIQFYGKLISNKQQLLKTLHDAITGSKFKWSPECDGAYDHLKEELTSTRVLTLYDPKQPLILACNASAYGLSAVLSHKLEDGTQRPIGFASKKIPQRDLNNTAIHKDASAIVFGFKYFYDYIYGKEITLQIDNKPLQHILGPSTGVLLTMTNRLQQWAYYLSKFQYKIVYMRVADNGNCVALSRLPIDDDDEQDIEFCSVNYLVQGSNLLSCETIARATREDPVLGRVMRLFRGNWKVHPELLTPVERLFYHKRYEIYLQKNCLMWGYRVIIPSSLRSTILKELHASHMGLIKIRNLARSYVWWPGIEKDLTEMLDNCKICLKNKFHYNYMSLAAWPWSYIPWSRIHCDLIGPFFCHHFLVVLDAHSKWPEIVDLGPVLTTAKLIAAFEGLLSRHGLPNVVVSDCSQYFGSREFSHYLRHNCIAHYYITPRNSAIDIIFNNFVFVFKSNVSKIMKSGYSGTIEHAVNLFLFDFRSTVNCSTGKTPALLFYNRELRTRFDLLKPESLSWIESEKQVLSHLGSPGSVKRAKFLWENQIFANERKGVEQQLPILVCNKIPSKIMQKFEPFLATFNSRQTTTTTTTTTSYGEF